MYVDQLASATLVGTTLSSNTASAGGGVYAAAQAHVTLTGVSLRHNTASNYGGGVHTTDGAQGASGGGCGSARSAQTVANGGVCGQISV